MDKEQLIALIKLLPIEELNGFKIYYYSEEKKSSYGGYHNQNEREEHNVNYGLDYDQLTLQRMDNLKSQITNLQEQVYQMKNQDIPINSDVRCYNG